MAKAGRGKRGGGFPGGRLLYAKLNPASFSAPMQVAHETDEATKDSVSCIQRKLQPVLVTAGCTTATVASSRCPLNMLAWPAAWHRPRRPTPRAWSPTERPCPRSAALQIRHAATGEPGKAMGDIGEMAKNAARVRDWPGHRAPGPGVSLSVCADHRACCPCSNGLP